MLGVMIVTGWLVVMLEPDLGASNRYYNSCNGNTFSGWFNFKSYF